MSVLSGGPWEAYALKYAERNARVRADSFLFDDHATGHDMDYYLWVLRRGNRAIVVDTGYDAAEGAARGRPVLEDPTVCLRRFGIAAEDVEEVIVTHLHYDHAGGLHRFPAARFHLQAAEMAYVTGPCMCEPALRHPYTGAHIAQMVQNLFSGRVIFHDGDAQVADGVEVMRIGGHARGLQAVRVMTARGPLVLASDAAHYYESWIARKLFPVVVDAEAMLAGFRRLPGLAAEPAMVIPGHDPLVRRLFPQVAADANGCGAWRLDAEPIAKAGEILAGFKR
ncbi:MAG: N-acyl homoserine lactonase family protein [Pseudomonadota bacterium]